MRKKKEKAATILKTKKRSGFCSQSCGYPRMTETPRTMRVARKRNKKIIAKRRRRAQDLRRRIRRYRPIRFRIKIAKMRKDVKSPMRNRI
jgi:hypothetical protein